MRDRFSNLNKTKFCRGKGERSNTSAFIIYQKEECLCSNGIMCREVTAN